MKSSVVVLMILMLVTVPHLLAQATGLDCVAQQYDVIALPLRPTHINESGQVAGTTSQHRAGLWSEQKGLREVPLPLGFINSEAVGVNSSGHLAGTAYDRSSSKHRAFEFSSDKLSLLEGEQSVAHSIDDSGQIAGEAIVPGKGTTGPVLWTEKGILPLGGCCGGTATGVNNHGQVIGDIYDKAGSYAAFLGDAVHGLQTIGPPNRYSSAIAVNDSGHVLIQAFSEAYLYVDGKLTQIDLSRQNPSQPRAINDCDVIVGSFGPFADANRAFVWEKSQGFRDLNSLIPSDSGWKLEAATSINDHGKIVGWGDHKGEDDAGFLLVPRR
jgi:uncharacterized membrane protein